MFYTTDTRQHGLTFDPFKALVVPRPIGWISTISNNGVPNLAPFSFFNAIADNPPMIMLSFGGHNDTLRNLQANGEASCSFANKAMMDQMNMSSAGVDGSVNEFELAGVAAAESKLIKPMRVADSPAAMECKLWKVIELPPRADGSAGYTTVMLSVEGVYINDDYLVDGRVDTAAMEPLARLGYMDYAVINKDNIFSLNRPEVAADKKTATLNSGPWSGKY